MLQQRRINLIYINKFISQHFFFFLRKKPSLHKFPNISPQQNISTVMLTHRILVTGNLILSSLKFLDIKGVGD